MISEHSGSMFERVVGDFGRIIQDKNKQVSIGN